MDPGHAPLTTREAQLIATLVAVAAFLTLLSFVTVVTVPLAVMAWSAVGIAMLVRPWHRRRIARHR